MAEHSVSPSALQIHRCPECPFSSSSPRKLGRHRSVNHGQVKYKCEQCNFVTGYQSNYYRHRKQAHSNNQPTFSCPKCDFSAGSMEGLTVHTSQMHKEVYKCNECTMEFNTKSQWQEHLRTYHGKTPQIAQNAQAMMGNENLAGMFWQFLQASAAATIANVMHHQLVQQHQQQQTQEVEEDRESPEAKFGRNYVCHFPDCGFTTRESRDHLHHLRDVHGQKLQIFYCDKCTYASKFLAKLRRHQLLIHEQAENGQSNSLPNSRPSSTEQEGTSEIGSGTNPDEENSDDDERKLFISETQQTTIDSAPAEIFSCKLCRYSTTEPARYRKHVRCHQTRAPTACKHCDFRTVYSWNLDRHVRCHFTPGRFICNRCTFSQNTRQSMAFHLQHHHQIERLHMDSQTEKSWDDLKSEGVCASVTVDTEPFNFETHAVRINENYVPPDQPPKIATSLLEPLDLAPNEIKRKRPTPVASPIDIPPKLIKQKPLKQHLTLDKMVVDAEREATESPDAMALSQRYLSEHDAIESPAYEREFRETEQDPDIEARTCSICGYQGKWISEMLRHKRVHTNARPFKCKYCSRTSKWKADLIRHVAKVHGIRVVSKYSRSKTFDSDPTIMRALKEEHGFVSEKDFPFDFKIDSSKLEYSGSTVIERPPSLEIPKSKRHFGKEQWQCTRCGYEHESKAVVFDHLANVHNLPPYSCPFCPFNSMYRKTCQIHIHTAHGEFEGESGIVENLLCKTDSTPKHKHSSTSLVHSDVKKARTEQHGSLSGASTGGSSVSSLTSPNSPSGTSGSVPSPATCDHCPFVGDSQLSLTNHKKGHAPPKGLISYKCVFCDWYSKKKQLVFEHLHLHTENPEDYIADVENNLITPLSHVNNNTSSPAKNALSDFVSTRHQCNLCPFVTADLAKFDEHQKLQHGSQSDCHKSSLLSEFGALLDSESTEQILSCTTGQENVSTSTINQPTATGTGDDHDQGVDSESEIEDRLAYVHAGTEVLDGDMVFALYAPVEIQKIGVSVEGVKQTAWKCRYCPHHSKRRANVKMHEKKHFKPGIKGQFKCPICPFRGDKHHLNEHYRDHVPEAEIPYRIPCSNCPATFRTDSDLNTHIVFHTCGDINDRGFRCSQCSYTVPTVRELHMHLKVHPLNDFNVKLPKFKTTDTLKRMVSSSPSLVSTVDGFGMWENIQQTPAAPKPKKFGCNKCEAKFSDNTQLKRHNKFHGVPLKYNCTLCDYSVPFPINLVKHLKAHHVIPQEQMEVIQNTLKKQAAVIREQDKLLKIEQQNQPDGDEESARVTPNGQPGSLKIKISLGKRNTPSPILEAQIFDQTPVDEMAI